MQATQRASGVQSIDLQLLPQEGNESGYVGAHAHFLLGHTPGPPEGRQQGRPRSPPSGQTSGRHTHTLAASPGLHRLTSYCGHAGAGTSPWAAPHSSQHSEVSGHNTQREEHLTDEDTEA